MTTPAIEVEAPQETTPLLQQPPPPSLSSAPIQDPDHGSAPTSPPSGPHLRTPSEAALVRKLDLFLLTFGCLSQVIKYLDQQNITNAYISGMRESLSLTSTEYNLFATSFALGYCLMLLPSQVLLTHLPPSLWLSGLEICWGLLTGVMATVREARQVYVLRFLLGLCESGAWPGLVALLMHWYTAEELALRMGVYQSCQSVGWMVAGGLQAGIMRGLDGRAGLEGWRWLFVVNCVVTVVWGAAGFWMLPDLPGRPNRWARKVWLGAKDVEVALRREEREGRRQVGKVGWEDLRRTLTHPLLYVFAPLYTLTVLASTPPTFFPIFLSSLRDRGGSPVWSVGAVNTLPILGGFVTILSIWTFSYLSDRRRTRSVPLLVQAGIGIIPGFVMSLLSWQSIDIRDHMGSPSRTYRYIAYVSYSLSYVPLSTAPVLFAWLADLLPHDSEVRSLVVGACVTMYYATSAWAQILLWPVTQAPLWQAGWISSVMFWLSVGGGVWWLRKTWGDLDSKRKKRRVSEVDIRDTNSLLDNTKHSHHKTSEAVING